jgi:hypothetical protein
MDFKHEDLERLFFFFWGGGWDPVQNVFFFSLGHNLVWDPWVSFLYIWNASLPQCQANASSAGILRGESPTDFGLITFHFNVNDALFNLSIYFAMMNGFPYFPNHYMYMYIYVYIYNIFIITSINLSTSFYIYIYVTGYRVLTSCYANLWLKNTAGKIASCIFSVHDSGAIRSRVLAMDQQQAAQVLQSLQELQTEVNRLRGREAELTAQVASFGAGPAASAGPGSALAQLVQSQKELVDALRPKEQVRLVDNKGLGKPDKFDGTAERFLSWKIKTSSYLASVRKDLREILVWAEDCDHAITADDIDKAFGSQADAIDQVSNIRELRRELWDALLMLTEREPFDIVLNTGECGIESWRKLTRRYDPSTGGRKRALLNAILSPARSKMEDLPSNLEKLLDSIRLYERRKDASGNRTMLAEDIKINVIERLVPAELERHLVLNRDRFKTFEPMLSEIQSYVEHATGNKIKVVNSQPYDAHGRGDDPMDVGSFGKDAKGKGKGKKGAGGKPGKGNATAEKRTCHNCGRPGHLRADCWAPGGPKHKGTGGKGTAIRTRTRARAKAALESTSRSPKEANL